MSPILIFFKIVVNKYYDSEDSEDEDFELAPQQWQQRQVKSATLTTSKTMTNRKPVKSSAPTAMINRRDLDYMAPPDSDDEGFELAREQWIQHQDKKARQAEQRAAEEARIAREKAEAFPCRRCPEKYPSNTKLHEHVRTKHAKAEKRTPPTSTPLAPVAPVSPPQTPVENPTPPAAPAAPVSPISPSPLSANSIEAPALPAPVAPPTPLAILSAPTEPPATPIATPKKPLSWAEIASKPVTTPKASRLPRLITKYGLPTPPPSPILQPQESTNSITKHPSITRLKTPYLTVEDLYTMFHGKPRPSSLPARQIRLPSAPPSGQMRLRQMRITTYFQPTSERPASLKAKLAPNRKHAESNTHGKSTQNRDLAPRAPRSASFSLASAGHPTHRTCRRCKQHFSSGNLLHRHLAHCSRGTFSCCSGYSSPELRMKRGG